MTEPWIAETRRYVQPLERQAPIATLRLDLRILIRKCISREPDKFLYLRFGFGSLLSNQVLMPAARNESQMRSAASASSEA